jgi:hypothetical protein
MRVQLNARSSICGALTAATAALLGSGTARATGDNGVESSILLYSEANRVQALEGSFGLTRTLQGGRIFNGRLTLDGLTGASPNGATPSGHVQTFTRPSGSASYSVPAGQIPLDNTFKDTRLGLDGSLTEPLDRLTSLVYGAHFSAEQDYTSIGLHLGFTRDFNRKNTTLSVTTSYSHDVVSPLGGAPLALSSMPAPTDPGGGGEEEGEGEEGGAPGKGKNVLDAVVGVTQVLDSKTLLRLNYSIDYASGYLNDPYKLLSVVQGAAGPEPGEPVDYLYESRPGSRTEQAVFAELRRYLGGHTLDLSYRYFWDQWGVSSQTLDLFYRLPLWAAHALQPHVRWYRQTGADFYQTYLVAGTPLPVNASADSRLAPFQALTLGLQYLFPVATGTHLSIGAEYYRQAGDLSPPAALGALSQYDLFPRLDAVMVRMGFNRDF